MINRVQRLAAVLFARVTLRGCALGFSVAAYGVVEVEAEGTISIGTRTTLTAGLVPTKLIAHRGAHLIIGRECMINAGSRYEAHERVTIGRGCLIASGVRIVDRDGERSGPIVIEDNVWLAHGAVIGPGVRIGRNSVVSAGTVVTKDVPADSLAMGDPARAMPIALVAAE